jgi:protein-export membrane protein SecD
MKKVGKPVFFVVLVLILLLTYTSFLGISTTFGDIPTTWIKGAGDIRWGIDVRGGVDVTFSPPDDYDASDEDMAAAEQIIKVRMVSQNITDYEIYTDYDKDRIIVRFPWKEDETEFNPEDAIAELGATARLTFREGYETDASGLPSGITAETIILEGKDVEEAAPAMTNNNEIVVSLKLTAEGAEKFAEATTRLAPTRGIISIWMDDVMISYPSVQNAITNGEASISGNFDAAAAKELADKINAGALPFTLQTTNFSTISPTLGVGARDAMVMAGFIAFAAICVLMIALYRLPGMVACIALMGQAAGTIAAITGYLPAISSFTLTLPGIAGIILSIGVGVDANVITYERIREELRLGRGIDAAIDAGYKRAFTAIFDGNITVVFVAVILMGAFGPPASIFAMMLKPVFGIFGSSTTGAIYSFGYTLLVGIILNFLMGVTASRLMLKSLSKFKPLRKAWLYGGEKK